MSQVKVNLQPPPNVDFVTGYPGIPPGQDRPQASVRGAVEVRVPPNGVKAKWVRIELRKVETLPGGGPANTFYDFVGPSPVNLWSTSDEYGALVSRDFPFSIRIPESIPPTIALDNRAGIGYELVASVCTKGKKGFLRKAKSVVTSASAPIIIDKHELHSTWPVYQQPETRQLTQEGVSLIVERTSNCYGPGDRVVVVATLKSDSLHTVILRGFEMFVKETTVFRAGVHSAGKKNAPQIRAVNIAETQTPVNNTLYAGTAHTSELSCMISPNHTTTTLNAARHIDVTYTLCIKAVLGTAAHLIMELPVIISNWQRHVSHEAINRIGPAASLSLLPPSIPGAAPVTRVDPIRPAPSATLPPNRTDGHARNTSIPGFNTLPATSAAPADTAYGLGRPANGLVDEFGQSSRPAPAITSTPIAGSVNQPTVAPVVANTTSHTSSNTTPRRPGSSGGGNRFVVKNAEVSQDGINRQRGAQTGAGAGQWPTAEDEKLNLYEQARANVAKVQGVAASPPPATLHSSPSVTASPPRGAAAPAIPAATKNSWLSAEEEKQRLFQQAQAAVARNQGLQGAGNAMSSGPTHTRNDSDPKTQMSSGSGSKQSTAAALYADALKARDAAAAANAASAQAGGSSAAAPTPASRSVPQYPSAEQEKAALKRYEEARRAVDRTQNTAMEEPAPPAPVPHNAPISYGSLYPMQSSQPGPPPPADAPPPFDSAAGPSNIMAHLSEKERLRRAYEAQDAAAARQKTTASPPPVVYQAPTATPPPAAKPPSSLPNQYANALEEKEALRKKFEARDNAIAQTKAQIAQQPPPPSPPPRNNSVPTPIINQGGSSAANRSPSASSTAFRPAPVPPGQGAASPTKVLTAAEEKALLRAKYEARDAAGGARKPPAVVTTNSPTNGSSTSATTTPVTPPPLMPRPPQEYIKETQEEDARLSKINGQVPVLNGSSSSSSLNRSASGAGALDMKPFTPFRAGFDPSITTPGPPPPLPSKPE